MRALSAASELWGAFITPPILQKKLLNRDCLARRSDFLRQRQFTPAVAEFRLGLLFIQFLRQREAARHLAEAALGMQYPFAFGRFLLALDLGRKRHLRAVDRHMDVFLLHPGQICDNLIGAVFLGHIHLQPGSLESSPRVIGHRAHEKSPEQIVHHVVERIVLRYVGHACLLLKVPVSKMGARYRVSSPLSSSPQTPDFRGQIESLRPYRLRYASLQLRNPEAAEDAVQEALLA